MENWNYSSLLLYSGIITLSDDEFPCPDIVINKDFSLGWIIMDKMILFVKIKRVVWH